MVPLAASLTLWSKQCLSKSMCMFDVGPAGSHSFLLFFFPSLPLPPLPLAGMKEHPPIPVTEMADHMERLKANDGLRFSQEYEVRAMHLSVCPSLKLVHVVSERKFLFDTVRMYSKRIMDDLFHRDSSVIFTTLFPIPPGNQHLR